MRASATSRNSPSKHVVGAAGGTVVHDLEADAARGEVGVERLAWQALALARAQQHDLGAERDQRLEISDRQRVHIGRPPVLDDRVARDDHAACDGPTLQSDLAIGAGHDRIRLVRILAGELHGAAGQYSQSPRPTAAMMTADEDP